LGNKQSNKIFTYPPSIILFLVVGVKVGGEEVEESGEDKDKEDD